MSRNLLTAAVSTTLLGSTAMADVPSVAVDIAPVHSLVSMVMEGLGEPALIVPPGDTPHAFGMRPSAAEALQNADLVFWVGDDLTPQLGDAINTLAEGATATALLEAEGVTLLDFREGALFEAHEHADHDEHEEHGHDDHDDEKHADHDDEKHDDDHDHAHGDGDHEDHASDDDHAHDEHGDEKHAGHDDHDGHDDHEEHAEHHAHDHGEHDPHAWLSPKNARVWLNVIASQLSAADPENAGTYFTNAAAGREMLDGLSAEINATLEPVRGERFIGFHDAYQYFEADFDFPASGAISLSDASDPSPARIAEIQERIRDEGVDCVLSEPQFNAGLIATVLEGTEAGSGIIDPLGADLDLGPELYPQLIRNMAQTLADCL